MVPAASSTFSVTVANAQSLLYQPPAANLPTNWYYCNRAPTGTNLPYFYAPFVPENTNFGASVPAVYSGDPGVRNPLLSIGYASSSGVAPYPYPVYPTQAANTVSLGVPLPVNIAFQSGTSALPYVATMNSVVMPPPIPPRRLFQAPDAYGSWVKSGTTPAIIGSGYTGTTTLGLITSNASDCGDPWINNQIPSAVFQTPTTTVYPTAPLFSLNNGYANIEWSGGNFYDPTAATPVNAPLPPTGALGLISAAYAPYGQATVLAGLGNLTYSSNNGNAAVSNTPGRTYLGVASTGSSNTDDRQHPFFRSEQLQKAMNLTTVRTHQYAVWITVGFFEVIKQGDIGMLLQANPTLAYDVLGAEVGAVTGNNVRFRGFFLVDRTKLHGFNPNNIGSFRAAVVYRKVIQ